MTCPVCGGSVTQPLIGRPRLYCSAACRRERVNLANRLATLESELETAENLAQTHYQPTWRAHHDRQATHLRRDIAGLRQRLPVEAAQ